jgi:hypothetical protein
MILERYVHPSTSQYCVVIDTSPAVPEELLSLYFKVHTEMPVHSKTHFVSIRIDNSSITNRNNSTHDVEIPYSSSSNKTQMYYSYCIPNAARSWQRTVTTKVLTT